MLLLPPVLLLLLVSVVLRCSGHAAPSCSMCGACCQLPVLPLQRARGCSGGIGAQTLGGEGEAGCLQGAQPPAALREEHHLR